METFSALLAICGELTGHRWYGPLMFSLICAWINGWVKNGEAGDVRRHRAHYDVAVLRKYENAFVFLKSIKLLKG